MTQSKDEENYKWPFWIMVTVWGISIGLFCWLAREVIANDRTNTIAHASISKEISANQMIILQELARIKERLGIP